MKAEKVISSLIWGIAFILFGIILLLDTTTDLTIDWGKWWPIIFIVIGIDAIVKGLVRAATEK